MDIADGGSFNSKDFQDIASLVTVLVLTVLRVFTGNYRLIIEKVEEETVRIIDVEDYHGN